MAISIAAQDYPDSNARRERSVDRLMAGISNPRACARRSQKLVQEGRPREGYLVLLEGMKRFEGHAPSLIPLYRQYQRGHLSELIREQEAKEQETSKK